MAQVEWTIQALDELSAICQFIEKDSVHYARLFACRVFDEVNIMLTFPRSGRIVPEFGNPDIREVIVGDYRIVYRVVKEELCEILAVYHGARLLKNIT